MRDRSPAAQQKLGLGASLLLRAGTKQALSHQAGVGRLLAACDFQGSLASGNIQVTGRSFLKSASRFAHYVLVTKGAKTSRVEGLWTRIKSGHLRG